MSSQGATQFITSHATVRFAAGDTSAATSACKRTDTNQVEQTRKAEVKNKSWQSAKHAKLYSNLSQAYGREPFDSSGFSTKGPFISAGGDGVGHFRM